MNRYFGEVVKDTSLEPAFIGPNVTFCNGKYPENFNLLNTFVGNNMSMGANSTILPGISVGDNVVIGAGSLVTKDIPSDSLVYNNGYAKLQKKFEIE